MMVSQKVRLLIMILCENHYDMMTISIIFRRGERIWLPSFLGYSLKAVVIKCYSSSGEAAVLAAYSPRAAWTRGQLREAVDQP